MLHIICLIQVHILPLGIAMPKELSLSKNFNFDYQVFCILKIKLNKMFLALSLKVSNLEKITK